MERIYDFIIIGGGPAGSTTATNLSRNGFSVLVLEKEIFPRFHVGESLLPFSYDLFKDLGVLEVMEQEFERKPGVTFSNIDDTRSSNWCFSHHLKGESKLSFHVRRYRFDQILLENSHKHGAELKYGMKVSSVDFSRPGAVEIKTVDGLSFKAKFVLDATGQDAFMGKTMGTKTKQPMLSQRIAVSTHWKNANWDETLILGNLRIIMLEREKKGWIWMIPVAPGKLSVGVVTELDYFKKQKRSSTSDSNFLEEFYKQELFSSKLGHEILSNGEMIQEVAVNSDYSFNVTEKYGDRFAIIGDASAFLDPMFASGVFVAMKGAMIISDALVQKFKIGNEAALALAYEETNGACQLIEKLIAIFYDPERVKFSELTPNETSQYVKFENAYTIFHLILAGDFFSNHKRYLDAVDLLSDKKKIDQYKHLSAQTNDVLRETCRAIPY